MQNGDCNKMTDKVAQKHKAAKQATKWAGAGEEAFKLAQQVAAEPITGKIVPSTPKNVGITIRGALKMFLDGNISSTKIQEQIKNSGLDMNDLRKSIVEQTVARALPQIINKGDIERLTAIAELAGEKPEDDIPAGAKRIMRERVIIEMED